MEIKDVEELQWKEAIVTPTCEKILEKAVRHYAEKYLTEQAVELAMEFRKKVKLIEVIPGIGTLEKDGSGIRTALLKKYRYNIYYKEYEKNIYILGIWHTSRGTKFLESPEFNEQFV